MANRSEEIGQSVGDHPGQDLRRTFPSITKTPARHVDENSDQGYQHAGAVGATRCRQRPDEHGWRTNRRGSTAVELRVQLTIDSAQRVAYVVAVAAGRGFARLRQVSVSRRAAVSAVESPPCGWTFRSCRSSVSSTGGASPLGFGVDGWLISRRGWRVRKCDASGSNITSGASGCLAQSWSYSCC